jgi:hypothetical protein
VHACMRVEGAGGQRPQRTMVRGAPGRRYDPCVARGVGRRCGSRRVGRSDLRACRLGRGTGRRAVPRWRRASADALTARQDVNLEPVARGGAGPRHGRHGMGAKENSVQNRHHIEPHTANRRYSTVNSLDTPPAVLPLCAFAPLARRHERTAHPQRLLHAGTGHGLGLGSTRTAHAHDRMGAMDEMTHSTSRSGGHKVSVRTRRPVKRPRRGAQHDASTLRIWLPWSYVASVPPSTVPPRQSETHTPVGPPTHHWL